MNAKSVYVILTIACSLFLYVWIPTFGSLKAYTTDNSIWLLVWGVWFCPVVFTAGIAITNKLAFTRLCNRVKAIFK